MKVREKKHRLPEENYRGNVIVSFTACISNRYPLFTRTDVAKVFSEILVDSLEKQCCDAHIYLFMPDHFHFLVEGKNENSDVLRFARDFKQRTGYWLAKNMPEVKWQKDFFDHVLRRDEDLITQVRYVLENPVRKGLTLDWKSYPFKGSTVYDFIKW